MTAGLVTVQEEADSNNDSINQVEKGDVDNIVDNL